MLLAKHQLALKTDWTPEHLSADKHEIRCCEIVELYPMSSSLLRHDGEAHARSISQSSRRYARLSRTESIYHSSFTFGASDLRRRYYVTPSRDKRSRFPVNRNSHGKRQSRGIFVNDDLVLTNANEFISRSLFLSSLSSLFPSLLFYGD